MYFDKKRSVSLIDYILYFSSSHIHFNYRSLRDSSFTSTVYLLSFVFIIHPRAIPGVLFLKSDAQSPHILLLVASDLL